MKLAPQHVGRILSVLTRTYGETLSVRTRCLRSGVDVSGLESYLVAQGETINAFMEANR